MQAHSRMDVKPCEALEGVAADLACVQGGDARQLQLGLLHAQALRALCHVALAQLRTLLVLDGAEHAEGAILACSRHQHSRFISRRSATHFTPALGIPSSLVLQFILRHILSWALTGALPHVPAAAISCNQSHAPYHKATCSEDAPISYACTRPLQRQEAALSMHCWSQLQDWARRSPRAPALSRRVPVSP